MLTRVNDSISGTNATNDFEDNSSRTSNEYFYDHNGNLVKDENKGIDTIRYNHLNLPEEIIFDATHKILYLYDALGNRLRKTVISGQNSMITDYVSNMVYLDDTLQMVMTEEGRMLALDSGGFQAEYFLKDHLGNNRLTIADADEDGDAEIVQEDHFYPYGMTMSGLSYRGSTVNNYLFQGKEQQSNFNLWWYDFGARMFDEQLGRWHVPMLQYNSPYCGMGNNPASMIDPNGMWTDAAYMSDLTGFDAYRLSKYRTAHNYNRKTNVLGKSIAQERFEKVAGEMDLRARQGFENSIDNIIIGVSNYAGVDASNSVITKEIIKTITEALSDLQNEEKVHEENSYPDEIDIGTNCCNGAASSDEPFPPVDLTGGDALAQLIEALSYASDYLHNQLPENEAQRWKDKPLTFGDLFDYAKFDKRENFQPYFNEIWKSGDGNLKITITLFASKGNTVYDLVSNSSSVIKLMYPYNKGGGYSTSKQGLRIEFNYDPNDYQSSVFIPLMHNSYWSNY